MNNQTSLIATLNFNAFADPALEAYNMLHALTSSLDISCNHPARELTSEEISYILSLIDLLARDIANLKQSKN